jgi:hypothetical protein
MAKSVIRVNAASDETIDAYLADKADYNAKRGIKMTRSDAVDALIKTASGRRAALTTDYAKNRARRAKKAKRAARGR